MKYSVNFLQKSFLSFFEKHGHTCLPGSSPIPTHDKTLLFTNAGMNQFKEYFTGASTPTHDPVTTAQRCIRAGGKHNDLDQVGFTKRHLTHFTMLGNFSFGKYFKQEAIQYAWEYLTGILRIDQTKLWVTVYNNDQEAFDIWEKTIGIEKNKIFKLGEKDNFWQMGDTGPCGPCSEIYYDRGIKNDQDAASFPSDDSSDRFIEIWNLVFIQFEKQPNGSLQVLQKPGIDTGMGLERLASVLQNKDSVFETDAFEDIISYMKKNSLIEYKETTKAFFHVLADHIRTASLLIAYGITPHNEGRGYVLRKIIRRALLFSRELSPNLSFFADLVDPLVDSTMSLYNNLLDKKKHIKDTILEESKRFFDNLDQGIRLFKLFLEKNHNKKEFSGQDAFTLYDTYGFPIEITKILASQHNLIINENDYENEMRAQQERSRAHNKFKTADTNKIYEGKCKTEFIGYHTHTLTSPIQDIITIKNEHNTQKQILFFEKTIFYPRGGGQIADTGSIHYEDQDYPVIEVIKYDHAIGIVISSEKLLTEGMIVTQKIETNKRNAASIHHSAVHLLHKSIVSYFNDSTIYQDGSYVSDEYFSLDMVMKYEVTYQDKKNIEMIINKVIEAGYPIVEQYMTLADAAKLGATAQFTEKYNPESVRVININPFTIDLCGGCHTTNTKNIGIVCLTEVISPKAGVKRFVGVAGEKAYQYIQILEEAARAVKKEYSCTLEMIPEAIQKRVITEKNNIKELELQKRNALEIMKNIILKEGNGISITSEFPILLRGYEKFVAQAALNNGYEYIILYNEKNTVYIEINPASKNTHKAQIEGLLVKSGFKGKKRDTIFEGIVENLYLFKI